MELRIGERLGLLDILPREEDYTTLKIIRELRENLSFSEEEIKAYSLRLEDKRFFWENDNGETKDIPLGEIVTSIIKKALKKLNDTKKLRDEYSSLYEKFVEG